MIEVKNIYSDKNNSYFSSIRNDIFPLLPKSAKFILDVGCGQGNTLSWLRKNFKCHLTCGIELTENAADIARNNADFIIHGNIESIELPFKKNSFDLILCLDIFEHLVDPWTLVKRLDFILKPGGAIIASIPNVKHHSVLIPLLLMGQWKYKYNGILDKTHLRFFTKKSAIELLNSGNLCVESICATGREKNTKSNIANLISLGFLKVIFEREYLIRSKKSVKVT